MVETGITLDKSKITFNYCTLITAYCFCLLKIEHYLLTSAHFCSSLLIFEQ